MEFNNMLKKRLINKNNAGGQWLYQMTSLLRSKQSRWQKVANTWFTFLYALIFFLYCSSQKLSSVTVKIYEDSGISVTSDTVVSMKKRVICLKDVNNWQKTISQQDKERWTENNNHLVSKEHPNRDFNLETQETVGRTSLQWRGLSRTQSIFFCTFSQIDLAPCE